MFILLCLKVRKFAVFLLAVVGFLLSMSGLGAFTGGVAASAPIANGFRDFGFPTGLGTDNAPTSEKPESKLWWNNGYWWASMWSVAGNSYHIYRLNMATQDWEDSGVAIDDRFGSKADVLWDEANNKLYVVSHLFTMIGVSVPTGQRGELYRYSYNAGTNTYSLDNGFPVEVNQGETEGLVIAKDTAGVLWVAYVENSQVMINHSLNQNDASWGAPFVLPVGPSANVISDDMASIIAYNGRIGVMWSSRATSAQMYFASHVDGTGDSQADWSTISVYTPSGDDHINLKTLQTDTEGNLFAVVKTSFTLNAVPTKPWIVLLACKTFPCTATNNWTPYTVWTTSDDSPTRAQLLIDTENRDLYIFSRVIYDLVNNKKGIYYKVSDLDTIGFSSGDGIPFITSATESQINDPTTTKQNVNRTTGLVVLASDSSARFYVHNCLALTSPVAPCGGPGSPVTVAFSNAAYTVNEIAGTATITASLNHAASNVVTVQYVSSNGTAVAGNDYSAVNGTLSFAVGETTKSFTVPILNDALNEDDKTVSLALDTPTNANLGMPVAATLTIIDDDAAPTVQVDMTALSPAENHAGGSASIAISLSKPSAKVVSLHYGTTDQGTATANADYSPVSNTLTFAPGEISKTILLPLLDDTLDEPNETVELALTEITNAANPDPFTAEMTILDDDNPPTVQLSAATQQIAENVNVANLLVNLSATSARIVTVRYQTSDGTAVAGSDYLASSGNLTFAPGETSKSIALSITNDNADEPDETVYLTLSTASNATLGNPASSTLSIQDDDTPLLVQFASAKFSVNENVGKANVTVSLNQPAPVTVTVGYSASGNTATSGEDYLVTPGTLVFSPGDLSRTFSLSIDNDNIDENDETVDLLLQNPSGKLQLGTLAKAQFTIVDNDNAPLVQFRGANENANENNSNGYATVAVNLSATSAKTISVTYAFKGALVVSSNNYTATNGVLVFNPGETTKELPIKLVNDNLDEDNTTLTLSLTGATNAIVGALHTSTLTIVDDDPQPTAYFSASTLTVNENAANGLALITVLLNAPSGKPVTVAYRTSDGTATAGSDYVAAQGQLTFASGETSKSFTLSLLDDDLDEGPETINLELSNAVSVGLAAPATETITIIDNDEVLGAHLYLPLVVRQ